MADDGRVGGSSLGAVAGVAEKDVLDDSGRRWVDWLATMTNENDSASRADSTGGPGPRGLAGTLAARLDVGLTRSLIDSLPGLFLLFDARLTLVAWNRQAPPLTGYGEDDLAGLAVADLFDEVGAVGALEDLLAEGGLALLEAPLARPDGRRTPYLIEASRFAVDDRVYLCALGIDVSDRKALEEQLLQAQKLEAIGALAGGIAHDLNNLLVPILGFAELSRSAAADRPDILEHLENVTRAAEHARSLVANILAFSRKLPPGLETFDLRDSIGEVATLLKSSAGRGITVDVDLPPATVTVRADRSEIRQVVLNLCTNAIHAMRDGGGTLALTLSAEEVEGRSGTFRARLTVADDGDGIDEPTRQRMFDPFFTTKPIGEGTGLGLSVVHGIVKGMGGEIEVESGVGLGTTVHVLLPLTDGAGADAASDEVSVVAAGRGELLMIVDDDPLVAKAMQSQLEEAGYAVEAFIDSRAARRAFEGAPDAYAAVLTDYQMPHLGGLALSRRLRELAPNTPIVLFSGFAEGLDPAEVRALGITYLDKPADVPQLSVTLRRLLGDA